MIRHLAALPALALVAVTLSVLTPPDAGATGWFPLTPPGGAKSSSYVNTAARPQACTNLVARGDGYAFSYISFEDGTGKVWGTTLQDGIADGVPKCANITPGATRARVGIYSWGGPSGTHHAYGFVFAYQDWSKFTLAYCVGCAGQPAHRNELPNPTAFIEHDGCKAYISVAGFEARAMPTTHCWAVEICAYYPVSSSVPWQTCRTKEDPQTYQWIVQNTIRPVCYADFRLVSYNGGQTTFRMWPSGQVINMGMN